MEKVACWIAECDRNHYECKPFSSGSWVPTRLLYFGNPGEPPRLVITSAYESRRKPKYTTLSHCWGSTLTLKLTTATLNVFLQGISPSDIPKTYADAIEVSRVMKVDHIWIDSLCIIQDSETDWNRECGQMAEVYKNGYCNIAASHAIDSHGGCFSMRDPARLRPLVLHSRWRGPEGIDLWEWRLGSDSDAAPLSRRGWVLQETTLSPRTLYFGTVMISWSCRTILARENSRPHPRETVALVYRGQEIDEAGLREFLVIWNATVERYTSAALTYPSDKLVAISAVAKELQKIFDNGLTGKFIYLAGLWTSSLESQLLWETPEPSPTPRVAGRAPTWSWASIDSPIHTRGPAQPYIHAQVADYRLVPRGNDAFLAVDCDLSTIDIRGRCWKLSEDFLHQSQVELGYYMRMVLGWDVAVVPPSVREPTYLLPILGGEFNRGIGQQHLKGLMLRRTNLTPEIWERVGIFQIDEVRRYYSRFSYADHPDDWRAQIAEVGLSLGFFGPMSGHTLEGVPDDSEYRKRLNGYVKEMDTMILVRIK